MIQDKIGSVFDDFDNNQNVILIHGVNCSNGFGSGIAGLIKHKYPIVKREFHQHNFKLGQIQPVQIDDTRYIINCATQERYGLNPLSEPSGMYCNYDAMLECFKKVNEFTNKLQGTYRIIMPRIGAGLAGGEWDWIRNVILPKAFLTEKDEHEVNTYTLFEALGKAKQKLLKDFIDYYEPMTFQDYQDLLWNNQEDFKRMIKYFNSSQHFHVIKKNKIIRIAGIYIKNMTIEELYSIIQIKKCFNKE